MNVRDILHIALYEAKLQSRQWEYRLFVLVAVIGITLFQFFLQGQGYCTNWKMVALPCSVPLVNAYLYSVVQALFVILMFTDFPRREKLNGTLESIYVRPMGNGEYTWGRVLGNIMLFVVANFIVMLCCIFFVNLNSLASFNIWYYVFYFLTLNLPSLVFIMGVSLWLSRTIRWRNLVLILLFSWYVISIIWLPYRFHGILDFLGTGVPNLFSGVTGHVGLGYYLLHRLGYLLVGLGLLAYSVRDMDRLPNTEKKVRRYTVGGITLVAFGLFCGGIMAMSYIPARNARDSYRESFQKCWVCTPCHISYHDITVKQEGEKLDMKSDLLLCNLNREIVRQPLLFLNPGLEVTALEENGSPLTFRREGQIILIDRPLARGDSLRLHVHYKGKIDDRFNDLQLSDVEYEDSFRGDYFFPVGRKGAFVQNDYLLLTPASAWYPVAQPPVNPVFPVYSGKDMTRYSLTVVHPLQKMLFSQGLFSCREDTVLFNPSGVLSGISLCGGSFVSRELSIDSLVFSLQTFREQKVLSQHFEGVELKDIKAYFDDDIYFRPDMKFSGLSWYEKENPKLYFIETPLPFRSEFNVGHYVSGQVEPGFVFLPENGFGMNLMQAVNKPFVEEDVAQAAKEHFDLFAGVMNGTWSVCFNSHPFRAWKETWGKRGYNLWNAKSLFSDPRLYVYSGKYPFFDLLLEKLYSEKNFLIGNGGELMPDEEMSRIRAYTREHSLEEALQDREIPLSTLYGIVLSNVRELVNHLCSGISVDSLCAVFDDIYYSRRGMIGFEEFSRELKDRGVEDIEKMFDRWIHTTRDQYFKVKDFNRYFYRDEDQWLAGWMEIEGKVMNCGKEGGFVYMDIREDSGRKYYSCYLDPGEAKAFHLVYYGKPTGAELNTGMSSNRPGTFQVNALDRKKPGNLKETPGYWKDTDASAFLPDPDEIVVDDMDEGFSLDDNANRTYLQKWLGIEHPELSYIVKKGEVRFWTPVIGEYYGDSTRRAFYKSFGTGNCSLTWKTRLKEGGRYAVMAKVGYESLVWEYLGADYYSNIVLDFTVEYGNQSEQIDILLEKPYGEWVCIGEFDFPPGETRVILLDKDEQRRENMAIIADAVKWVRLNK